MSRVYIHSNNHVNHLNKLMINLLIVFIGYGFYKNGISLYKDEYVGIVGMFKPLLFVIISLGISFLFKKIDKDLWSYCLLQNLFISVITPFNTNILVYIILNGLLNVILKYYQLNIVPIYMLLGSMILLIVKNYSFLNIYESSVEHNFSFFDYLLGKGIGGISNTFLLVSIIAFILLMLNINYKKNIPMAAFVCYYVLATITTFVSGVLDQSLLLNNNVIFAFIFLTNISIFTPYSKGGGYLYGMLLGILTYLTYFIDINIGVYFVIMLLSFSHPLLDKFIVGRNDNALVDVL